MYVDSYKEIFEIQEENFKVEALVTSANEIKSKRVKRRKKKRMTEEIFELVKKRL